MLNYDLLRINKNQFRPFQKADGFISPQEFPHLVEELLQVSWPKERYSFSAQLPSTETLTIPTIVWKVKRRVPGSYGDSDRPQRKPRTREVIKTGPDAGLEIETMPWTVLYSFDCYGQTQEEANDLLFRFERFMRDMAPIFSERGVRRVFFEEHFDNTALATHEKLRHTSIIYKVLLEDISSQDVSLLTRVKLQIRDTITIALDEPVIRTSNEYDQLANDRFYSLDGISDTIGGATRYVVDTDYKVLEMEGKSYILWNEFGLHPDEGSTYYVTYYYYKNSSSVIRIEE